MENMEMPTQMTVNAPTTIGGSNSSSNFEFQSRASVSEVASDRDMYTPGVEPQTTPGVAEAEFVSKIRSKSTADMLLDSAKEDGFEDALQKFIDGQFEEDDAEQEEEIVNENSPDRAGKKDLSDSVESAEVIEGETIDGAKIEAEFPIEEKIRMLEERAETLQEENKVLLERVKAAEMTNSANQEIMLVFAKALYELAKRRRG